MCTPTGFYFNTGADLWNICGKFWTETGDPRVIWDYLAYVHLLHGSATCLLLQRKFLTLFKSDLEGMMA
jgi:hypothetical protein